MKNCLVIDDDKDFSEMLCSSFSKRGFNASYALNGKDALEKAENLNPEYVVLDLKIHRESGLHLIPKLLEIDPYTRIVILTGYASIATAIEAIKLGAIHYLSKPVLADEVMAAFDKKEGDPEMPIADNTVSVNQLEWWYIRKVLNQNRGNISATARELKMHRRTLQRKLDKMPASE